PARNSSPKVPTQSCSMTSRSPASASTPTATPPPSSPATTPSTSPRCPSARWPTASWTRSARCGQPHRPSSRHPAAPAIMPDSCTRLQIQGSRYCGGATTPGVPPSLPGTAPFTGACRPRERGGCSEHTSEQLWPTLATELTWMDAPAAAVRGVSTPSSSIWCPTSLSSASEPFKVAHTVPLLITSALLDPGAFCTHPENFAGAGGFGGSPLSGVCPWLSTAARLAAHAIAIPSISPRVTLQVALIRLANLPIVPSVVARFDPHQCFVSPRPSWCASVLPPAGCAAAWCWLAARCPIRYMLRWCPVASR